MTVEVPSQYTLNYCKVSLLFCVSPPFRAPPCFSTLPSKTLVLLFPPVAAPAAVALDLAPVIAFLRSGVGGCEAASVQLHVPLLFFVHCQSVVSVLGPLSSTTRQVAFVLDLLYEQSVKVDANAFNDEQ